MNVIQHIGLKCLLDQVNGWSSGFSLICSVTFGAFSPHQRVWTTGLHFCFVTHSVSITDQNETKPKWSQFNTITYPIISTLQSESTISLSSGKPGWCHEAVSWSHCNWDVLSVLRFTHAADIRFVWWRSLTNICDFLSGELHSGLFLMNSCWLWRRRSSHGVAAPPAQPDLLFPLSGETGGVSGSWSTGLSGL